jgi:HSP20 family protein
MSDNWINDWEEWARRLEREMEKLHRDFEQSFSPLLPGVPRSLRRREGGRFFESPAVTEPYVDIIDKPDEVIVTVDLPGVDRDNITLNVKNDELELSAERKEEIQEEKEGYVRRERTYSKFHRTIDLPAEVDGNKSKASFRNGVLEIILPKKESGKGNRIKIT